MLVSDTISLWCLQYYTVTQQRCCRPHSRTPQGRISSSNQTSPPQPENDTDNVTIVVVWSPPLQSTRTRHRAGQRSRCWRWSQGRWGNFQRKGKLWEIFDPLCRSTVQEIMQRSSAEPWNDVTDRDTRFWLDLFHQIRIHVHIGRDFLHLLLLLREVPTWEVVTDLGSQIKIIVTNLGHQIMIIVTDLGVNPVLK